MKTNCLCGSCRGAMNDQSLQADLIKDIENSLLGADGWALAAIYLYATTGKEATPLEVDEELEGRRE